MGRGILPVSHELLEQLIGLKDGIKILGVRTDPFRNMAEILLEGPEEYSLPHVAPGAEPPMVEPEAVLQMHERASV